MSEVSTISLVIFVPSYSLHTYPVSPSLCHSLSLPPTSVNIIIYKPEPLWRTAWRFLKKLKIELPYDPAIPLLGRYSDKIII